MSYPVCSKKDPGKVPGTDAFGFSLFMCFLLVDTLFDIEGEIQGENDALIIGLACIVFGKQLLKSTIFNSEKYEKNYYAEGGNREWSPMKHDVSKLLSQLAKV